MDKENISKLAEIIGALTDGPKPTESTLGYNGDAIRLYNAIYDLKDALKAMGYC